MNRKIVFITLAIMALAAFGAFAGSTYPGDVLPPGAVNPGTYQWNGTGWEDATYGMSWNSGPESSSGMSNKETHTFDIINHVSVAQWVEYSISGTRKDWRILRPGIYASNSVSAVIKSNNDVIIEFYATDPVYQDSVNGGSSVTPTIPKWFSYSEGNDPAGADANGWYRASEYDAENPLVITMADSAALHAGLTYKIWEKIEVVPSNSSSDYEGDGTVTIKLTNMKHWVDPETGSFYEPDGKSPADTIS